MKYLFSLLLLSISHYSFAQIDTTKIYNCKQFKKGFYKSYNEFITNSPSITYDFTLKHLSKHPNDTLDTRVDYTLIDSSKRTHHVWGFCDGTDVYVKYDANFWKLHAGRYPFFSFKEKGASPIFLIPGAGLIVGGIIAAATTANAVATASQPYSSEDYTLCIITDTGKFNKRPLIMEVRKLVSTQPELVRSDEGDTRQLEIYENETNQDKVPDDADYKIYLVLKEYLFKLNEKYKNNISK